MPRQSRTDHVNVVIVGQQADDADILAHGLTQAGMKSVAVEIEAFTNENLASVAFDIAVFDLHDDVSANIIPLYHELCTTFDGPVLVLCYERDERFLLKLYREGIAECIVKPIGMLLLLAKVKAWLRRISTNSVSGQNRLDDFLVDANRRAVTTPQGIQARLSKNQYQLFELLYRNRGRTLSTALLTNRIWGTYEEGDNRLKYLVLRLRRKIEPDDHSPSFIESVDSGGYRFRAINRA